MDDNQHHDAFVYERANAAYSLISHAPGAALTTRPGFSRGAALSADGRYVLFDHWHAFSPDFGPWYSDVIIYDRAASRADVLSRRSPEPSIRSRGIALSSNGRRALFHSDAGDLDARVRDANRTYDTFVFDADLGSTTLVSRSALSPGSSGNGSSLAIALTAQGDGALFASEANDLSTAIDVNSASDSFFAEIDFDGLFSGGFEGRSPAP